MPRKFTLPGSSRGFCRISVPNQLSKKESQTRVPPLQFIFFGQLLRRVPTAVTVIGCSESARDGRAAGVCGATGADQGDRGRRFELAGMAFVIQFPPFFESRQQ